MNNNQQPTADAPVSVLVLDDELPIRHLFKTALAARGCSVATIDNARGALQLLMQQSFDVLVVDLRMEGMNGIVFLQEALKVWPWIGVVIVSGFVDEDTRPQAEALGVTRILEKPVGVDILCDNVIEEARTRKTAHRDIPRGNALALMRDHLKLLTNLDQTSMGTDTLLNALLEFGKTLSTMMAAETVGILVINKETEQRDLLLFVPKTVSESFLTDVKKEILARHKALSGTTITIESIRIKTEGKECDPSGPTKPNSWMSLPIILEDRFCGVLALASEARDAYTPANVSLLYHAANHIAAVFMSLRRMHQLAARDHLTGVFNRIRLEEELERAWLLAQRYEESMATIVVDIDNFKTINDSFGHAVGDEILRDMAQLMQAVARASDIIARYGGDEFVAVLPHATEANALAFGERFLDRLRDHVFCENTHKLSLSSSIGIATSRNPTMPATSDELLSQADRALFMAKRAGRNRITVWPEQTFGATGDTDVNEKIVGDTEQASTGAARHDRIMIVDDEESVLDLVGTMLARKGYEIVTFSSTQAALEAARSKRGHYDVLLTDLSMPDKSGIELMHELTEIDSSIVKIVMTGFATVDTAVECLREGAYDFIQKPVRDGQLTALLERALEYRHLKIDNARYQVHLEEMVKRRSTQLAASLDEVRRAYDFTLEALVAMLDAREKQTGKHSFRTRDLTVHLARIMGLGGDDLGAVASGAFLHDIGKIGIPDSILLKPGPLTDEEWEVMRTHSEIGYNILRSTPYLKDAAELVLSHHERYDGSGYPRGIKGENICFGARVFGVVDAYDTMRSARVYRDACGQTEAVEELLRHSGKQFDPHVVDAFIEHQDDLETLLNPGGD